jgi:hypothetical protein
MPRTLEEIQRDNADSSALRGLVGVLNDKLQLRARYGLLEYEAGLDGRQDFAELYRYLSRIEREQIARLSGALAIELRPPDF